jgi:hypothetical protein
MRPGRLSSWPSDTWHSQIQTSQAKPEEVGPSIIRSILDPLKRSAEEQKAFDHWAVFCMINAIA